MSASNLEIARGAYLILVTVINNNPHFIMARDARQTQPTIGANIYPWTIEFIGGGQEKNESSMDTVIREGNEETGGYFGEYLKNYPNFVEGCKVVVGRCKPFDVDNCKPCGDYERWIQKNASLPEDKKAPCPKKCSVHLDAPELGKHPKTHEKTKYIGFVDASFITEANKMMKEALSNPSLGSEFKEKDCLVAIPVDVFLDQMGKYKDTTDAVTKDHLKYCYCYDEFGNVIIANNPGVQVLENGVIVGKPYSATQKNVKGLGMHRVSLFWCGAIKDCFSDFLNVISQWM